MPDTTTGKRRPRADGEKNRAHILAVAEQVFAEEGIGGSINEIAKRAKVGAGTMYRHFPSRDALLAALLETRDRDLQTRRKALERAKLGSADKLEQWLDAVAEWSMAFEGLPDPLREALLDRASPLTMTCEGFVTVTDTFLNAAQDDERARRDVGGRELFLAVLATTWVRGAAMADDASYTALRSLIRSGWATAEEQTRRN